jgi:hypothetical protein
MKVLLLSSPIVQKDFDRIARLPNLGLVSLAAHVDDLCTVHVADIHGMKDHREYVRKIVNGYDLVGLTAMSFQYREALGWPGSPRNRAHRPSSAATTHSPFKILQNLKTPSSSTTLFGVRARPPSGS